MIKLVRLDYRLVHGQIFGSLGEPPERSAYHFG